MNEQQTPGLARLDGINDISLTLRAIQGFNKAYCHIYHRLAVRSACRFPARGAAIIVSNHTSGLDPFLIQALCSRVIVWMMAREYYEIRGIGWFFRKIEAIPVERTGRDSAALRLALRALKDGRMLGIFPEGKIETSHDLLPFQPGMAAMALKTGAPIYPVYLDGTQRGREMAQAFLLRSEASINFGPPLAFDHFAAAQRTKPEITAASATAEIESAVDRLRRREEALRQALLRR